MNGNFDLFIDCLVAERVHEFCFVDEILSWYVIFVFLIQVQLTNATGHCQADD